MNKIMVCTLAPFAVLFAGLSPAYTWAIPLTFGLVAIIGILCVNDWMDDNVSN